MVDGRHTLPVKNITLFVHCLVLYKLKRRVNEDQANTHERVVHT